MVAVTITMSAPGVLLPIGASVALATAPPVPLAPTNFPWILDLPSDFYVFNFGGDGPAGNTVAFTFTGATAVPPTSFTIGGPRGTICPITNQIFFHV